MSISLAAVGALLLGGGGAAQVPRTWVSRGPGGGGAFFAPGISPFNPSELYVKSDMSDAFHSLDGGLSWTTLDFRKMQGGSQYSWMQFTSDPNVRYGLSDGVPKRTADGGATWTDIPQDIWSPGVYCLHADPDRTNRLFVANYSTLYFSTNSGASYAARFTTNDFHIAGALFADQTILIGTRAGLVVSANGGATFTLSPVGGIPATEAMVSFAGARQNGVTRLFCVTLGSGDVYPGVTGSDHSLYRSVYRLNYGVDAAWQPVVSGIAAGDHPFFVSMCRTNIAVAYVAGGSTAGLPIVYKTADGGSTWQKVFRVAGNENVCTGWSGDDPGAWNWRKWSFGEYALGFNVCPSNPDYAVITDLGFIHATTNGGAFWQQAYCHPADQNATNSPTDKVKPYHGVGIEDTSCWWLTWADSNTLFAGFTDIRGMLSTNAGRSWTFPSTLSYNSTYQAVAHPSNGYLYAAASSVHDLYAWDRYCKDSAIDGGSGAIIVSTNRGAAWQTLHSFGRPAVGLSLDPHNPNRLYACMVNSASGGVYRTTNLLAGAASAWTRLASPPRTEGHPYLIHVLNDGTLVCSYSARITSNFTASAGVFVSTNEGAAWLDRTAAGMRYYTKDVVIDPADPGQNTWYAGVWGEWGTSSGLGGLYVTTNRGVAWARITTNLGAVGSCTIDPGAPDEMYVATESQGLWYSANRRGLAPVFTPVTNYPFRFPSRVFFNPYDTNEVWVTSYGNGLRLGRRVEPTPVIQDIRLLDASTLQLRAAGQPGQRLQWMTAETIGAWTQWVADTVLDAGILRLVAPASTDTQRFYRLSVVAE